MSDLKISRSDLHIFAPGDPGADLRIQGIHRPAAGHLYIVLLSPLEAGDQKQKQLGKGHKDTVVSISAALAADHQLVMGKILSPLRDTDHQKHGIRILSRRRISRRILSCIMVFMIRVKAAVRGPGLKSWLKVPG